MRLAVFVFSGDLLMEGAAWTLLRDGLVGGANSTINTEFGAESGWPQSTIHLLLNFVSH